MSDQSGTGAEGAPEQPQQQEQAGSDPPEWLGPINERMNELSESSGRMAEQLAALYGSQAEPEEDEYEYDESGYYDDEGELTPEGAQALIDQRVDERVQTALSSRDAVTALEQREDAFEALREEIPALQDDELAARLVREVRDELVGEYGPQMAEQIIGRAKFVDLIEDRYYAEQYHERVKSEREQTDGNGREVVLESASGASQPSKGNEPDWGQRVLKAAESLRPQI